MPRRAYSRDAGRLLHDRTAEQIAEPISWLKNVVATIIPVDVNGIIETEESGEHGTESASVPTPRHSELEAPKIAPQAERPDVNIPISHYEPNVCNIGDVTWRKRAHILGQVTSLFPSGTSQNPNLSIEVWDKTGGITLEFLGRRHLAGVKVGSVVEAEGMVGEKDGTLVILNPTYELLAHGSE